MQSVGIDAMHQSNILLNKFDIKDVGFFIERDLVFSNNTRHLDTKKESIVQIATG